MSRFQFPTNGLNSRSIFDLVRGTNFSKTWAEVIIQSGVTLQISPLDYDDDFRSDCQLTTALFSHR